MATVQNHQKSQRIIACTHITVQGNVSGYLSFQIV